MINDKQELDIRIKVKRPLRKEVYNATDPPGHGRIGGHYFHTGCPYVRHKNKNALQC